MLYDLRLAELIAFDDDVQGETGETLMDSGRATSAIDSKGRGPSKMAELIAMHRVAESMMPEDVRICYDPYAACFVDPEILKFARENPEKAREMREHYEKLFPGLGNSIRARVRYFDDFVASEVAENLEQLVILGAGYDTRAYRIGGLDKIKVFEIDHPDTQRIKQERIEKIFGRLLEHVVYVPVNFGEDSLGEELLDFGYSRQKKTLFVMEGLIMYIPPQAVDDTLAFIAKNSGKGSKIIFDYYPLSLVNGTSSLKSAENIKNFVADVGEPLTFGIEDCGVEEFLSMRGFCQITGVSSEDYRRAYFYGKNKSRNVSSLLYFAYATVK